MSHNLFLQFSDLLNLFLIFLTAPKESTMSQHMQIGGYIFWYISIMGFIVEFIFDIILVITLTWKAPQGYNMNY